MQATNTSPAAVPTLSASIFFSVFMIPLLLLSSLVFTLARLLVLRILAVVDIVTAHDCVLPRPIEDTGECLDRPWCKLRARRTCRWQDWVAYRRAASPAFGPPSVGTWVVSYYRNMTRLNIIVNRSTCWGIRSKSIGIRPVGHLLYQ